MILWPDIARSPRWDHGHDEEPRNGPEVTIDIYDEGIRVPEEFHTASDIY